MELTPNTLPQPQETEYVLHRRFDRMGRLVGDEVMKKLLKSHVMVIGLGGVGSWAAESLARSGVGKLTVVDFDEICITNANRQIHAIQGLVGHKKALVMGERLKKINPQAVINAIPEFYNAENSEKMLAHQPDFIVDAIDNLTAKSHLLATCRERGIKVITSAGSAAKLDPLRIKIVDLADTTVCPMAHQLRKILRQKHNFPEKKFDIPCVFSDEVPMDPIELKYDNGQGFKCVCPQNQNNLHSCEHRSVIWGTASFVTGAFGLAMASHIVREIRQSVLDSHAGIESQGV
jgi:tRNA A37 threonylcarbamoyladenosine dehydratase